MENQTYVAYYMQFSDKYTTLQLYK